MSETPKVSNPTVGNLRVRAVWDMSTDLMRKGEEVAKAAGKTVILSFAECHNSSSTCFRDGMESRAPVSEIWFGEMLNDVTDSNRELKYAKYANGNRITKSVAHFRKPRGH